MRLVAITVPIVASAMSGIVLSRVIGRPSGILAEIGWWLLILFLSTVVLTIVDRGARRLLPLATLLKLSMAFPDQAPSRFSIAARSGTTRSLRQKLEDAQRAGADDEPSQAAERILTLVGALGAHDRRTRGHCERVRAFNDLISEELGLPEADRDRLRWAALLHDIGKLHVTPRILNKPKRPTEREWAILKSHPTRGARITAPLAGWLGPWAPTIEQHHERWDGTGYPAGISGMDISLGARIVAVADAYEVMTAPRPYSRPVSAAAARAELARCAGGQFDPDVVRAFLNISIGRLRKVMGPLSWLAQLPFVSAAPRLESVVGAAGRQVVTAAASATGGGVLAVSMLPQASHAAGSAPSTPAAHASHLTAAAPPRLTRSIPPAVPAIKHPRAQPVSSQPPATVVPAVPLATTSAATSASPAPVAPNPPSSDTSSDPGSTTGGSQSSDPQPPPANLGTPPASSTPRAPQPSSTPSTSSTPTPTSSTPTPTPTSPSPDPSTPTSAPSMPSAPPPAMPAPSVPSPDPTTPSPTPSTPSPTPTLSSASPTPTVSTPPSTPPADPTPSPTPTTPTPSPTLTTPTPTPTTTETAPDPGTPSGVIQGTVTGPLVVNSGQLIELLGATVQGPVTVKPGGALITNGASLSGPLTSNGASFLGLCNSQISGPVTVTGSTGFVGLGVGWEWLCAGNVIDGPVTLTGNTDGVRVVDNQINGPLTMIDNTGRLVVAGNTVSGTMDGTGNDPITDDGWPNSSSGSSGDLAGFGGQHHH